MLYFSIMQMFILDKNPVRAVRILADVHVRKMCLETAQILSSVLVNQGRALDDKMPHAYNLKHPVITAINSEAKINYTVLYFCALQNEFLYRFGKKHKYFELKKVYFRKMFSLGVPLSDFSFCRAFKDFSSADKDTVKAYRSYYLYKKSIIKNWKYTRRKAPDFLS